MIRTWQMKNNSCVPCINGRINIYLHFCCVLFFFLSIPNQIILIRMYECRQIIVLVKAITITITIVH